MPNEQENTPEALEEKILKWLKTQGYPLEMEAARAFKEAGFRVTPSEYYCDPETQKLREIDVYATYVVPGDIYYLSIAVTVECKSGAKGPWVFFTKESDLYDKSISLNLTSNP